MKPLWTLTIHQLRLRENQLFLALTLVVGWRMRKATADTEKPVN